jgi:hypothetical protein
VRLEGVAVYTTAEVLRIAREEEAKTATKKRRGPQKKVVLVESSSEEEDEVSKESEQEVYRSPVTRRRCAVLSHVRV